MRSVICLLCMFSFFVTGKSQQENLQEMLNRKQYHQIVTLADQLDASESTNWQTMYIIGQAYEGLMKYPDAYGIYQHCLSLDSMQIELLNAAARMAANLGKLAHAESYFMKMWVLDSTDFYANVQLARFYSQTGNDEKAIDYYDYLLENDPDNPALLRAMGDCLYRLEDKYSAGEVYWYAFQSNRENAGLASTFVNTALPFKSINDGSTSSLFHPSPPFDNWIDAALDVCDTALYYNPDNQKLLQNKATTLFTAKKYMEADSLFTLLLAMGDSSYYNLKYGGSSRYWIGRNLNAVELLEVAFLKDSTDLDVCLLLGSALGRTFDRKRAYALFDKAEELMKPVPAYVNILTQFRGDIYMRDGKILEAYQIWLANKDRNLLANIWSRVGSNDVSKINEEEQRSRSMFMNQLIATERASFQNDERTLRYVREQLTRFKEEMFFRSMKEYPMISPDNKRSTITAERLDALIKQL